LHRTARFNVAAAAALAAGSVIAVTPATPALTNALHDVQAPAIRLTATGAITDVQSLLNELLSFLFSGSGPVIVPGDPLQTLQADELLFNNFLTGAEVTANTALVSGELTTEETVAPLVSLLADSAGSTDILHGTIDDLFNAANIITSSQNIAYDVIFGANTDPTSIVSSLFTTANPDGLFDSGAIGGIEGILSNSVLALYDFTTFFDDQFGLTGASNLPATLADLTTLQTAELQLGTDLGKAEFTFDGNLVTSEEEAIAAAFGSQSTALTELVDRVVNADNELLATGENLINFVLGAENISPTTLTADSLIPSDTLVFDSGSVGGLEGAVDQLLAGISDAGGLTAADFATGAFDTDAFTAALSGAFDINAFDPVGTDLAAVATDLTTILTSLF
jgi:hypothetical protein